MNKFQDHNQLTLNALLENSRLITDKLWRLNNLYWITTKDGTKEPFRMNRAQQHFYDNFLAIEKPYHRHIVLKSRQLGFTTFIDLYILDEVLFNTNKEGLVIAHKVQDAAEIFDRKIDFAIRNMISEVKETYFKLKRNSAKKIQVVCDYGIDKGSTSSIHVSISGRSATYQYVHISEFAKMCRDYPKNATEVITGTFPAVPFDGYIFIESTAEGMSGYFYDIFQESWMYRDKITPTLSRVQFLPHFYNWTWDDMEMKKIEDVVPVSEMLECEIAWAQYQVEHELTDMQMTYYYMKWQQLGKNISKLKQEFPTTAEEAFINSGEMYFPTSRVVALLAECVKGVKGEILNGVFMQADGGNLEIFSQPESHVNYVIGGDTAEGLAHGDAQVLLVINAMTEDIVAIYQSRVPPDELAEEAVKLGKYYNNALLAIENNKDGLWVNNAIEKTGYTNIYCRKSFDDATQKMTKFYGWKTTSATRPFSLATLKEVFRRKSNFPEALLREMLTFVRNAKGRPEAMIGEHDDLIMAAGIGYSVLADHNKQSEQTKSPEKSLLMTIFGE